jgi:hypothetical protein
MYLFVKNIFETNLSNSSFHSEVVYSDQNDFIYQTLVNDGWDFVGCVPESEVADIAWCAYRAKSCRKVTVSVSFEEVSV